MVFIAAILALAVNPTPFGGTPWRFYTAAQRIRAADVTLWDGPQAIARHESLRISWATSAAHRLRQTNQFFVPLASGGFGTDTAETNGALTLGAYRFDAGYFYFCLTMPANDSECQPTFNRAMGVNNVGFFSMNTNWFGSYNFRFTYIVLMFVLIIFAVVMVLGELHVAAVTTKFTFFFASFTKGLVYIALGVLVMAVANVFGLVTAILLWITGIINMVVGRNYIVNYRWNEVTHRGTTTIITRREYQ